MSIRKPAKPAVTVLAIAFLFSIFFSVVFNPLTVNASDGSSAYDGAPGARAVFGGQEGTELFLGGNYIELGISNWGDFGTEGTKPENFRGTLNGEINPGDGSDLIGMSADHDGYNQGRDLPVDYYLPGTPEERFVVGYHVGSQNYTNTNAALMADKNMPTTVRNDSDTANGILKATIISTWADTMEITQMVSFKVNDKFYRTEVTIKNLTGQSWDGARYMRSVDPDNSQYRGGDYITANTVTHTIAEDGKAVVKAETADAFSDDPIYAAIGSRIPFFYYSTDPAARASVFGFTNTTPYLTGNESWDGANAYDQPKPKGEAVVDDVAITITWDSGELAPDASKSFIFYTSLDERDFEEVEQDIESMYAVTFGVAAGDGSLSAAAGDMLITSGQEVVQGTSIEFTAEPDPGSYVKDWLLNGTALGETGLNYTITDLQADTDIRVEFTKDTEPEETTTEAPEETTTETPEETTTEAPEETTTETLEETTTETAEETTELIISEETVPLAETEATTEAKTEPTTQETVELKNEEIPQTGQSGSSVVIGSTLLALAGSLIYILHRKRRLN